jgi:hypothetical protein
LGWRGGYKRSQHNGNGAHQEAHCYHFPFSGSVGPALIAFGSFGLLAGRPYWFGGSGYSYTLLDSSASGR